MSRRIRTLKPELLDDDKTAALSHVAWRLFVSGLLLSDDHGNLRAGTTYLLGQVFHSCAMDATDVKAAVAELVALDLWQTYTVRGQTYAHISGWSKHQRIDNAGKPKVPTPSEADGSPSSDAAAKNPIRGDSPRVAAVRGESPRFAAVRGGSRLEGDREREEDQDQEKYSAPAAQAPVCVREGLTSDPPEPKTAAEPPPSAKTAPSALPDDADEDTGPLTSRGASLPLFRPTAPAPQPAPSPAPVVVLSPEPCPAPPPVASPVPASAAPVTAAPSPSGAASASRPTSAREAAIREVFDFWQATVWKSRALYNDKRRTRIAARLAEGFSVEDLKMAARGATHDDNLMGRREGARQGGWRDVETVFRDAAQVERLMQLAPRAPVTPRPPPPPTPADERPADSATRRMVAAFLAGTYEPPSYPVPRPASPYTPPVAAVPATTHGAAHV